MSFRLKTVLGIALIEAFLLTILIVSGMQYLRNSNEGELIKRAESTVRLVATMTGDAVVAYDLATLDVLVAESLRNPDLVYLRILGPSGVSLSAGGDPAALAAPFILDESISSARADARFDIMYPIIVGDGEYGHVEIGVSIASIDATLNDALLWMVTIALSEMVLVALLGLGLGHYLTRQLLMLQEGAHQVASGDFGRQLPITGRDELAETAQSFNQMSTALADYAAAANDARLQAESGKAFAESTLRDALDSMSDAILVVGTTGEIILMNDSYAEKYNIAGLNSAEEAFKAEAQLSNRLEADFVNQQLLRLEDPLAFERCEVELNTGERLLVAMHKMSAGGVVVVQTDVTALYEALDENRRLEAELMQKQKAAALGRLVGGIAHEMNTPIQFMSDNTMFLSDSLEALLKLTSELGQARPDEAARLLDEADWDFLSGEIPQAFGELGKGLARIRDLVEIFKQFAVGDEVVKESADVMAALSPVIEQAQSDWSNVASINVSSSDAVPMVPCHIGQLSRVIRALIDNASHAIEDAQKAVLGEIQIEFSTDKTSDQMIIAVSDNGCGIGKEDLPRVFDMLFTTKSPGRGMGHGLSLCQAIIERGHGGRLLASSELNTGSIFSICLPLKY